MGSPQMSGLLRGPLCVSGPDAFPRWQWWRWPQAGAPALTPGFSCVQLVSNRWSVTDSSAHGVESVLPKGRFLGVLIHSRMMGAQALLRSQMLVPGSPGWGQSCSSSSRARPTASSSPPSGGCFPDLKASHVPPSHFTTPRHLFHPAWRLAHLLCLTTCSLPTCQPARCTFKPQVSN